MLKLSATFPWGILWLWLGRKSGFSTARCYFVAVARAKVWIFNCKMPMYLYKKKSQIYLQTWHGTPLKRLGHDIEPVPGQRFYRSGLTYEQMCRTYDVDSERYDAMISPNAFCTGVFPHAFGIKKEKLIETGYPRNDFLSTYYDVDSERYDAMISPNAFCTGVFPHAFGIKKEKLIETGYPRNDFLSTYTQEDVQRIRAMISPNAFCTGVFPHAFGIKKEKLIETGYPRNDFLSTYTQEDVQRIRADLKIPEGKKVILYAPTWRDDSFQTSGYTFRLQADFRKWKERLPEDTVVLFKPHYLIVILYAPTWRDDSFQTSGYTFRLQADFRKWKERLPEDTVVLFKPHYLIVNQQQDDPELQDFLISVPADTDIRDLYDTDIRDLYVVSDALVTDYSSVFFDYGILKRPVYFYMYDLEAYAGDLRGFYMDIEQELPGKIYRTEESLLQDLAAGEFDDSRYPAFTKRYNNREDGQASRRVLDWLAVRLGRHTASEQAGN